MNKEEFIVDEKTYENYEGLTIKIVFSNLGRRYKKIGEQLYLMLEKESAKLEDNLTAMIRSILSIKRIFYHNILFLIYLISVFLLHLFLCILDI